VDRVEPGTQAPPRDLVQPEAGARRGRAADLEGLQTDGVVALLNAADLDMDEVARFQEAVGRCAVDERGARPGAELRRDGRVVGSGATHRVFDLRGEPAFGDSRPGVLERGVQACLREPARSAQDCELVTRLHKPSFREERGGIDTPRGRKRRHECIAQRVRLVGIPDDEADLARIVDKNDQRVDATRDHRSPDACRPFRHLVRWKRRTGSLTNLPPRRERLAGSRVSHPPTSACSRSAFRTANASQSLLK
jgi:hypothetical protein